MLNLRERLIYHFHHPNYLFFLISLLLLILVPPFADLSASGRLAFEVSYGIVLLAGSIYVATSFTEMAYCLVLGTVSFLAFIQNLDNPTFNLLGVLTNLLFFGFLFIRLLIYLLRSSTVNVNSLYAGIAAYLVLGIVAMPLCGAIQYYFPGSYSSVDSFSTYDLLYYCYTTITTVGYGDVTPVHPIAKSLAILLSIAGQLYITFVVAIIIGKYLANDFNQNEADPL